MHAHKRIFAPNYVHVNPSVGWSNTTLQKGTFCVSLAGTEIWNFQPSGGGGNGGGEWVMMEEAQISKRSEEVQSGMEREDGDKTGEGRRRGPEQREVTRADLYWSLQTASLSALTGHTVNSQPLPPVCAGGAVYVHLRACVSMQYWAHCFKKKKKSSLMVVCIWLSTQDNLFYFKTANESTCTTKL